MGLRYTKLLGWDENPSARSASSNTTPIPKFGPTIFPDRASGPGKSALTIRRHPNLPAAGRPSRTTGGTGRPP